MKNKNLQAGDPCPAFTGQTADGPLSLKDLKGGRFILYFYPKDDTPGCTAEACAFRDNFPRFKKLNVKVLGVSKDDLKSHGKFTDKFRLPFILLSDSDGKICESFGVWTEKSMYGRTYMGIERSTFLVDEKGSTLHIWRNVKVAGHIEDILKVLQ